MSQDDVRSHIPKVSGALVEKPVSELNSNSFKRPSNKLNEAPQTKKLKVSSSTNYSGVKSKDNNRMVSKFQTRTDKTRQNDSLYHHQEVFRNQNELSELNSTKMSLITKMQKEEFKLHILGKEYEDLKQKSAKLENSIDLLKEERNTIGKDFEQTYRVEKHKNMIQHDSRVNGLKEEVSSEIEHIIQSNLLESEKKRRDLEQQCLTLEKSIKSQGQTLNKTLIKLKESHNKNLINLERTMNENISTLQASIETLQSNHELKSDELRKRQEENSSLASSNTKFSTILKSLEIKYNDKEKEIAVLETSISNKRSQIQDIETSWKSKELKIKELNKETHIMTSQSAQHEISRRQLHNKLQELKGNIRVFCRIRPVTGVLINMQVPEEELNEEANQELVLTKLHPKSNSSAHNSQTYKFQFDKIFGVNASNTEIFEELSQLIQSSLDGYNVCVFAYGQTGSGKTYTMSNPDTGMIPLSLTKIFEDISTLESQNWEYTLEGQFIEIYNDTIIDLLSSGQDKKHEIKHDESEGRTIVTNTTSITLTSLQQAQEILLRASKNRSTAFTQANERSSRSHSIFILRIRGQNTKTGAYSEGTLNLVDLAGSERLSSSQARGERLRETQAINKSLSCLGDVIYALGQQQNQNQANQHIPYRNSKLTYLLKNSLGGSSKTLMFVNISPLEDNFNETVNSLRFATKVNSTKLK